VKDFENVANNAMLMISVLGKIKIWRPQIVVRGSQSFCYTMQGTEYKNW